MADLIPHLGSLFFGGNPYGAQDTFAEAFVLLHRDGAGDDTLAWRTAQGHWEYVVQRCLDSDAVDPHAVGEEAIRQAVIAALEVLQRLVRGGRCPRCPAHATRSQDTMSNRGGA